MRPELFDVKNDPEELRDLAPLPEYAEVLAYLERQLRARVDPEAADAAAKADQDRLVEAFGGRDAALKTGTPAATPVPVE